MSRDYLKKPVYVFNHDDTNTETNREPVDVTFMTIKIGFAGITALLMLSLMLFCILSWPWLKSQFL